MPDTTEIFVPTRAETDFLFVLDGGAPVPFPEDIKLDMSERLYENGFITAASTACWRRPTGAANCCRTSRRPPRPEGLCKSCR